MASLCPPGLHGVYRSRDRSILSSRSPPGLEPYAQTLDRPLPFNPVPYRLPGRQEPTTAPRSSSGHPTFRLDKSTRRIAPVGLGLPFRCPSPGSPTRPCSDHANSPDTGSHQTGRSPLAANLELLPLPFLTRLTECAARCLVLHTALNSTACSCSSHIAQALRHGHMLAAPDLASSPALWWTDLTSTSPLLPVPDSRSPYDESC